jgi:hypothetical protein
MGLPLYMRSVIDRNVVMQRMTVFVILSLININNKILTKSIYQYDL